MKLDEYGPRMSKDEIDLDNLAFHVEALKSALWRAALDTLADARGMLRRLVGR